jgi:hypothetical protein
VKSTGKTPYQSSYSTQVEGTLFHLTPRTHVLPVDYVFLLSVLLRLLIKEFHVPSLSSSPVPVAARSKAWVCGRLPAETVGSNPTEVMEVCCEFCQVDVSAMS